MTLPIPSQLESPPEELCKIDGVVGILFQRGGRLVINDMPFDDDKSERIGILAQQLCEGFRKSRRLLRQVLFGYSEGVLLVQSRDDAQLVLFLMGETDLNLASKAAHDYLADQFKTRLRLPSLA